jgi:hypothetical protein
MLRLPLEPFSNPVLMRTQLSLAVLLLVIGVACTDDSVRRLSPITSPNSPQQAFGPCRFQDDSTAKTRVFTGTCFQAFMRIPSGWRGQLADPAMLRALIGRTTDSRLRPNFSTFPSDWAEPDTSYTNLTSLLPLSVGCSYSMIAPGTSFSDGVLSVTVDEWSDIRKVPDWENTNNNTEQGCWQPWSKPPYSESATPRILYIHDRYSNVMTDSVIGLQLSQPVTTFGFEIESANYGGYTYKAVYYLGATKIDSTNVLSPALSTSCPFAPSWCGPLGGFMNGDGGARLLAVNSPNAPFDRVEISNPVNDAFAYGFAIANLRYHLAVPLRVACTPNPVVRGNTVACSASMSPAEAFTVNRREAKSDSLSINEPVGVVMAAGATYTWSGPAIASTRVVFTVRRSNSQLVRGSASFSVVKRAWPDPQLVSPAPVHRDSSSIVWKLMPYPANGILGGSVPRSPYDSLLLATVTPATSGPNKDLVMLTNPYRGSGWEIFIHPGLYPVPAGLTIGQPGYKLWHYWHDDQDGVFSGNCTQADVTRLIPLVERHEGVAQRDTSHFAVAVTAYAQLRLADSLERLYVRSSDAALARAILQQEAWDTWFKFHDTTSVYAARQKVFDATDSPRIFALLNCVLDFDPFDPIP